MRGNKNIYMPFKGKIKEARNIGRDVKLFKVVTEQKVHYSPGQFFMVGKWGAGEVPISVTSTHRLQRHLEFAIKKAGKVTTTLHNLKPGETMWLRGPYGNGFSTAVAKKKDVVFIAGGIGIIPLRSLINFILIQRKQYKKIFMLYGAKNSFEILFEEDIKSWEKKGVEVIFTVDVHHVRKSIPNGIKDKAWNGNVGPVTEHLDKIKTDFKNACAYICGPEIMIENTIRELSLNGMSDRQIATTLEARMKCGMGKCGQCYRGTEYICTNGPVYTYEEMKKRYAY